MRRSLLLLCLMGPAFAINFALYYVAAALLPAEGFGLFYIAVTTANVLYSGSFVLNIFFTRYLVSVVHAAGESAAYAARGHIQSLVFRWGAPAAAAGVLVLSLIGQVDRRPIAGDRHPDRARRLQRLHHRHQQGLSTKPAQDFSARRHHADLDGVAFRASPSAGWRLFGTTSGGLLGVVLAAGFVVIICSFVISSSKSTAPQHLPALPAVRDLLPVAVGYVSLIAVSNLDVLLTYLLLKDGALGAYSASSVLPKGVLMIVTPLLQMLYPMMVGRQEAPFDIRRVFQKSLIVVFALSSVIALGVFGSSGLVCGGSWGLKLCQPLPLGLLLISAVTLSVLRALVLYHSARGRDWKALSMLVPAAAYFWIALDSSRTVETIAIEFTVFSALLLPYYGGLMFLAARN